MYVFQADYGAQITGANLVRLHTAQTVEDVELGDGVVDTAAIGLKQGDALPLANLAGEHSADGNAAHVIAVIEGDDEHLQRCVQVHFGSWDML